MQLLTLNAAGKPLAPPAALDPKRRRLSQVVGRHVDRRRPHMIAVQRARDPLQPIEEAWVVRGRDRKGQVRPWPRMYLPVDAIVVVVYLPRGGGGGSSSGSRGKSPLSIALGIAGIALVAFAGPLGGLAAGALGLGTTGFAASAISAGIAVGGAALLSIASRSKANKQVTDTTQVYGVAGGGNLPKPGDRIPRGYGRSWMKPDLSQPDFSQYDGDDQLLFKRHTLGVGKYRPYQIRAGKQVVWQEDAGFVEPFNDARNEVEFVYGTASTLIPSDVVSATGIGGALPRPNDFPAIAGPFLINQRGALVSRLQVDFQFPQGISATITKGSGATLSNQPGAWGVTFEYAPIDDSGHIAGPWETLYSGTSATEGLRFATHPLRYTKFKDVPPGRYAVRGRNLAGDTASHTGTGVANIDAAQWDGASGWVADTAIRDNVTEMALRLYATKATQAAAFSEIEIDAAAIIPVWNGSAWVEEETSKAVWAFVDILRDQDYGGGLPDDQIDVGTALGYASSLTEYDTFNGSIRGPVSVYEAAATVLLAMRGEPVHTGRYWSLVRDEPKSVRRHLITRRQILKGSTQISFDLDTASGAGHVIGEFDQDGDYRNPNQCTAIYGEASLTPTRQRWTGVTSFAHAQHLTRWRAACGAYRRQSAPFSVEMEGRIYRRGDSIGVDQWFVDTRKAAGIVSSLDGRLVLDADVVVAPGDAIVLRDRTGREWGPLALAGQGRSSREVVLDLASQVAVEQATGLSLDAVLSDGRQDMTTVLVGPLATLRENYLIRSVRPDGSSRAQVEALIDDARVWGAIGAAPSVPPDGFSGLSDPESPRILGITAQAVPIAAGLRCDYTLRPGRGCVAFEVGISYDNGAHIDARPDSPVSGSIELNPVDPTTIIIRARGFGATGLPGPYYLYPLALPAASVNAQLPPIDYAGLTADVQARLAHILDVEAYAQSVSAYAQSVAVKAQADFNTAYGHAEDALTKALQSLGNDATNAAAITSEANARLTADQATTDQLTIAVSRIDGNTAAIVSEATTRAGADGALSTRLDAVLSIANGNTAAIVSEQTTRAGADGALSNRVDAVLAKANANEAAIVSEQSARADAVSAQASRIDGLTARVGTNEANIIAEQKARSDAVSAQAVRVDSLTARVGTNESSIISEQQTRATQDQAITTFVESVRAAAANTSAALTTEVQARADQAQAITDYIASVNAQVGVNTASILTEASTRATQDSAIASYADAVNVRAANIEVAVNNESTARFNGDSFLSQQTTDLYARNDQATAVGRFQMTLAGSPAGITARIQALVAVTRGGQTRGAGFYVDLADDGSSRFVVDANAFYITSNGSSTPMLSFDGYTLTIPSLRVTNSAMLPNSVSQSGWNITSNTSVDFAVTARANSRISVQAMFDGAPTAGLPLNGAGRLQILRDGNVIRDTPINFYVAGNNDNRAAFTLQTMTFVVDSPGAGGHTYTVRNTGNQGPIAYKFEELAA